MRFGSQLRVKIFVSRTSGNTNNDIPKQWKAYNVQYISFGAGFKLKTRSYFLESTDSSVSYSMIERQMSTKFQCSLGLINQLGLLF